MNQDNSPVMRFYENKNGESLISCEDLINVEQLINTFIAPCRIQLHEAALQFSKKGLDINASDNGCTEVLTEPEIYKNILETYTPTSVMLKDWLAYIVLPAIRKHGMYTQTPK
jgi:hypothetical protein